MSPPLHLNNATVSVSFASNDESHETEHEHNVSPDSASFSSSSSSSFLFSKVYSFSFYHLLLCFSFVVLFPVLLYMSLSIVDVFDFCNNHLPPSSSSPSSSSSSSLALSLSEDADLDSLFPDDVPGVDHSGVTVTDSTGTVACVRLGSKSMSTTMKGSNEDGKQFMNVLVLKKESVVCNDHVYTRAGNANIGAWINDNCRIVDFSYTAYNVHHVDDDPRSKCTVAKNFTSAHYIHRSAITSFGHSVTDQLFPLFVAMHHRPNFASFVASSSPSSALPFHTLIVNELEKNNDDRARRFWQFFMGIDKGAAVNMDTGIKRMTPAFQRMLASSQLQIASSPLHLHAYNISLDVESLPLIAADNSLSGTVAGSSCDVHHLCFLNDISGIHVDELHLGVPYTYAPFTARTNAVGGPGGRWDYVGPIKYEYNQFRNFWFKRAGIPVPPVSSGPCGPSGLILYMRRPSDKDRALVNEDALCDPAILSMHGLNITCVRMEEFSAYETILLVSSACMIVHAQGSALNNAIFLPKRSIVVELDTFAQVDAERGVHRVSGPSYWFVSQNLYLQHLFINWQVIQKTVDVDRYVRFLKALVHVKQRNAYYNFA